MPITMNDLTVSPVGLDRESLLASWHWLSDSTFLPVLLTAMGDAFVQKEDGSVHFLDTVEGTLKQVAGNGQEFQNSFQDEGFVMDHFFPGRVVELKDSGMILGENQCYSHIQLLVLGGADELENIEATDISVHFGITGQVHQQVKDLPSGTPINDIKIDMG